MELEFLNTEPDFDFSWLPEDLEEPDSIGSKDMQIALDSFCYELRHFLIPVCHGRGAFISAALRDEQTLREMLTGRYLNDYYYLGNLRDALSDWVNEVFKYPIYEEAFEGLEPDAEIKAFLSNRDNDIPRRLEAMRRLRKSLYSLADPRVDAAGVRIDMTDWDEKHKAAA